MADTGSIDVTFEPEDPPVAIVELAGEHDSATARMIGFELMRLEDAGYGVVVDLRRTTFVDSATLSELLTARREAEEIEGGFVLLLDAGATQVEKVLSTTGLTSAFAVCHDRTEAVAAAREHTSSARADEALHRSQ